MSTFGDNLTKFRKSKRLTRPKMVELLEIPKYTYRNWEYGINEPPLEMIVKISKVLGVSTDMLLGNEFKKDERLYKIVRMRSVKAESK